MSYKAKKPFSAEKNSTKLHFTYLEFGGVTKSLQMSPNFACETERVHRKYLRVIPFEFWTLSSFGTP